MQLCILFSFGPFLIGFPLADCHAVDGVQNIAQRLVLAHQCVTAGDENVPQLRVFLKIGHQPTQLLFPCFLGTQGVKLKIEPFALKVVHTLTRCAESSAGASHGVGDEDGHFRITAVDVMPVGQQPAGGIGFTWFYDILPFPGTYLSVGFHQLG